MHVPPPPPNQMLMVRFDRPIRIRHMSQPIGINGVVSIDEPNDEAFGSIYNVIGELVEDVSYKDLDLGR